LISFRFPRLLFGPTKCIFIIIVQNEIPEFLILGYSGYTSRETTYAWSNRCEPRSVYKLLTSWYKLQAFIIGLQTTDMLYEIWQA